ncbi:MAG: cell division protein FtsQ/DivIB [Bauldia sp.]
MRRLLTFGEASEEGGRVLHPLLRRPARLLARAEWHLPRHAGLKGMAVLFLATGVAGVSLGGHVTTVISAVASWSGLGVESVKITGQSETSELDVLDRLDMGPFPSLVTFDADGARERIEALPWVSQATVRKLYPDTIEIAVTERTPYAIWQHGLVVSLIDREGKLIADTVGDRYAHLPMVVGEGAAPRAVEFSEMMAGFPGLQRRVKAGVLIAERRWNVVLGNGVEILLPEEQPATALARLAEMDATSNLLDRDIVAVDLRVPDQLVVRLSERAKVAREEMLKERDKLAKKKGTST